MGAEPLLHTANDSEAAPLILGLQPAALIDHVARVDSSLLDRIPGDRGGSMPVGMEELENILSEVKSYIRSSPDDLTPVKTIAGGSVANTIRGLSAGFGVSCGIIGAYGDDEQGKLFVSNMGSNGVNLSRLRMIKGPTAQGNELSRDDFKGSKWLVMRYSIFSLEVIQAAVKMAKQERVLVSLDLASFEMVRNFRLPLLKLLESGDIDLCFANEDEAKELIGGEKDADPEVALEFLAKHCQWAVVTLGANGCIAKHGKEVVRVPAIGESKATDATGAGDLFASGFLYGLVKGLSLVKCCQLGSCSGGSVIRALGGEVTPENRQWMHKHLQVKGLPLPEIPQ
ncbi:ydjH, partial [Cucurbita argyrosperma subsp. argyrosperma]